VPPSTKRMLFYRIRWASGKVLTPAGGVLQHLITAS
jgi:hypothetical protein